MWPGTFHPQFLHGKDVGAVVDVRRSDAVPDTVTWQKRHAGALQVAHDNFVRGIAKRGLHGNRVHDFEVLHRVQAASADDAQNLFGH
jgi:hypothetical protein